MTNISESSDFSLYLRLYLISIILLVLVQFHTASDLFFVVTVTNISWFGDFVVYPISVQIGRHHTSETCLV